MPIVMKSSFCFGPSRSWNAACPYNAFVNPMSSVLCKFELCNKHNRVLLRRHIFSQSLENLRNYPFWRATQVAFCFDKDVRGNFTNAQLSDWSPNGNFSDGEELELLNKPLFSDGEELELLNKPLPMPVNGDIEPVVDDEPRPGKDEALEPFLKFFKSKEVAEEHSKVETVHHESDSKKIVVEYYDPKPGDFVVGVVVSGNENKLDVNVGADLLGTMLTKEVLPLYDKELDYLLCDLDKNAEEFMTNGKMGIIRNEDAVSGHPVSGRPVVDAGTVLFAEVLGRTLSGRPLLSTRRFFRRIAWHRVRQIEQLNEPIMVTITEWNTGGLLTRIEGLRAFLPKAELVNRVNSFTDLKDKVGCKMYVQISRLNESDNDLILSEREAWEQVYLREGTLLEGTVRKIYPYGAQVRIGESNRSGLLHASNMSRGKFDSVSDLLAVGEKIKVLVVRSLFPDKISLSIADLESVPGLFISDKEKVFEEAAEMAKKYQRRLPRVFTTRKAEPPPSGAHLFDKEENLYANWKWFIFQRGDESNS